MKHKIFSSTCLKDLKQPTNILRNNLQNIPELSKQRKDEIQYLSTNFMYEKQEVEKLDIVSRTRANQSEQQKKQFQALKLNNDCKTILNDEMQDFTKQITRNQSQTKHMINRLTSQQKQKPMNQYSSIKAISCRYNNSSDQNLIREANSNKSVSQNRISFVDDEIYKIMNGESFDYYSDDDEQ